MSKAEPAKEKGLFYTIKEGSFRLKSHKDDPEARPREYTNPKTKTQGIAYERVFDALYGTIKNVEFRETSLEDGTVLRSMNIYLGKDDDSGLDMYVSLPQDSRFTADFLKKLPNIDLTKDIRLKPYDFEPKEGPRKVGLAVDHRDAVTGEFKEKVRDFFLEAKQDSKGKWTFKNLHGLPEATAEDKSDWPFYFKKVNKFLKKYAEDNILPKFAKHGAAAEGNSFSDFEPAPQEITPDEIPF